MSGLLGFELPVVEVVVESPEAKTFVFDRSEYLAEFEFQPGQFLTVAIPGGESALVSRCYSISTPVSATDVIGVTVKRTEGGYASNWLCDNIAVGDHLRVLPPEGSFVVASPESDLLLFAGGSGITPLIAIAEEALAHGHGAVWLFYANQDRAATIFEQRLRELEDAYPDRLHLTSWFVADSGLPSTASLAEFIAAAGAGGVEYDQVEALACGPMPFMKLAVAGLRDVGVPKERRSVERFSSLAGDVFTPTAAVVAS